MPESQTPDAMINLVKFLVCLAILGIAIALFVYFTVVLPHAAAQVPSNYLYPGPRPTTTPVFFVQ